MTDRRTAIVDDHPSVLTALARLPGSRALEVKTVDLARRFLAALDGSWPLCLILDLQMPEMTGIELQRHMRGSSTAGAWNHGILGGLDPMATFAKVAGIALPEKDRACEPICFDSFDMSPVLLGNSDGDPEMLQWTTIAGDRRRFGPIVQHTDARREHACDREPRVGRPDKGLRAAALHRWTIASMKDDWKRIFPFDQAGVDANDGTERTRGVRCPDPARWRRPTRDAVSRARPGRAISSQSVVARRARRNHPSGRGTLSNVHS